MTPTDVPPEPQMSRAWAVVATFNPGPGLIAVVRGLRAEGVPVLVVDDASGDLSSAEVLDACEAAGAVVRRMSTNAGIGRSLNSGAMWLLEGGGEFLLTLDQDTVLPPGYVQSLVDHYDDQTKIGERPGVVGPAIVNDRPITSARRTRRGGGMTAVVTIQSGSLFPAAAFRELGLFREDFVMDCIDHDFCLRVRRAGWSVSLVGGLAVSHALGDPSVAKLMGRPITVRGRELHVSNHSPDRRYYMTRNSLLLARWNIRDVPWLAFLARYHLRDIGVGMLFEDDVRPKRAAVREGIRDAACSRAGRRDATIPARPYREAPTSVQPD